MPAIATNSPLVSGPSEATTTESPFSSGNAAATRPPARAPGPPAWGAWPISPPAAGPFGHALRGGQGCEGRAAGADLMGPGAPHLPPDRDPAGAHARDRDVEAEGRLGSGGQLRVDLAEAVVQDVAQPLERQVGH